MRVCIFSQEDVKNVSDEYKGLTGADALAPNRKYDSVMARHCLSYVLFNEYNISHSHIGVLTSRDRSSSNHSIDVIDDLLIAGNPQVIRMVGEFKSLFLAVAVRLMSDKIRFFYAYSNEFESLLREALPKEDAIEFLVGMLIRLKDE